MIKTIATRIFLVAFIITSFVSCMSPSKYVKSRARLNTNIVPPDFDPQHHILLFAEMPRLNKPEERNNAVTNKLDKALKEYCPYKYEIVSLEDIYGNSKYQDMSVYKFAIVNSLNSTWHTTTTTTTIKDNTGTNTFSVAPTARTTKIDFSFVDRSSKKNYGNSGNALPQINYTIAAFMATIKKAKGS
jgi:hypothetical protein